MHNGVEIKVLGENVQSLKFGEDGSLYTVDPAGNRTYVFDGDADFMVFDGGKAALIDYETDSIVEQIDLDFALCTLDKNVGFIKYFSFMQPGDVLWNGEALISENCEFKLMLKEGQLVLLNGTNHVIWAANNSGHGEKLEFLKNGNMALYSYSASQQVLWETA